MATIDLKPEEDSEVADECQNIALERFQLNVIPRSTLTSNIVAPVSSYNTPTKSPFAVSEKREASKFKRQFESQSGTTGKKRRDYQTYLNPTISDG